MAQEQMAQMTPEQMAAIQSQVSCRGVLRACCPPPNFKRFCVFSHCLSLCALEARLAVALSAAMRASVHILNADKLEAAAHATPSPKRSSCSEHAEATSVTPLACACEQMAGMDPAAMQAQMAQAQAMMSGMSPEAMKAEFAQVALRATCPVNEVFFPFCHSLSAARVCTVHIVARATCHLWARAIMR